MIQNTTPAKANGPKMCIANIRGNTPSRPCRFAVHTMSNPGPFDSEKEPAKNTGIKTHQNENFPMPAAIAAATTAIDDKQPSITKPYLRRLQ